MGGATTNAMNTATNNKSVIRGNGQSTAAWPGLQVYRQRRRGAPPRDLAEVPAGRKPWDKWPEDYHGDWYVRIRIKGTEGRVFGARTCVWKEALELGVRAWEACRSECRERMLRAFDVARGVKVFATMGEIFTAYLRHFPGQERNVTDARACVGWAKGWRSLATRWEMDSPEARRVDALGSGEVLTKRMVLDYLAARQEGTYDYRRVERRNLAINNAMLNFRALFSRGAMTHCYDHLSLPDLSGWRMVPLLKVPKKDLEEEMIRAEDYERMQSDRAALAAGDCPRGKELALVNWMLSLLGLRTRELLEARREWLECSGGEWYLVIKNRAAVKAEEGGTNSGTNSGTSGSSSLPAFQVKNARPGSLRLGRAEAAGSLASVLVPRKPGFLILPDGLPRDREHLIRVEHNEWLKARIGEVPSRQGNHRLRKYVASMIAVKYDVDTAVRYLRDTKGVALEHYIAHLRERMPHVQDADLSGWR